MSLDLFAEDQSSAASIARANPVAGAAVTFGEAYDAAVTTAREYGNSLAEAGNRYDVVQSALDRFEDASGEVMANPEGALVGPTRAALYDRIRNRFAEFSAANPTAALTFPTEDEVAAGAVATARAALQAEQRLAGRPGTFASGAGSFLGGVWGTATDPLNIASMAFGAPASASILRTALTEAGIAAGSQAAIEGVTADFKQEVDPNYGAGDAAGAVAEAALGGLVLGGGIKALVTGAQRVFGPRPPTTAVRDAVNVAEREASILDTNPLPDAGVAGQASHRSALTKAATDIEAGRPVDVTAEMQAASFASDADFPPGTFEVSERQQPLDQAVQPVAKVSGRGDQVKSPVGPKREDLATFIARLGGVRDDQGHALRKGRNLQRMTQYGPMVRVNGGSDLDTIGEKLWQEGFFGPTEMTERPTEAQVLDLLEQLQGKRRVYKPEATAEVDMAIVDGRQTDIQAAARDEVLNAAREMRRSLADADVSEILSIMAERGVDAETAVDDFAERLAMMTADKYDIDIRDIYDETDPFEGTSIAGAAPARGDGRQDGGTAGRIAEGGGPSGRPDQEVGAVAGIAAARQAPDAIAASAEMPEATLQEALRVLRADMNMMLPVEEVDGALRMSRADDLLADADADIAEAEVLAGCALAPFNAVE